MLKGIDEIERASQEAASLGSGNWIRNVKLKDGDIALIRFLTDKEDLIRAKFHDVKKMTPKGEFPIPVFCTMEDTGICSSCSAGAVAYNTINLWAWVYYILHKSQNPTIKAGSSDGIWQQVKQGKVTMYKEEINAPMWFRTKYGYQGKYKQMIVDFASEAKGYGTLIDRDYSWSRTGSTNKDTNYNLMAKKEGAMTKEVEEAVRTLPDLGDVVCGKIRRFGQVKKSEEEGKENNNGAEEANGEGKEELF